MGERRFVSLAMPQTATGKIRSVGRVNHRRAFPIAERTPPQDRHVRHQLIETRINEIDELDFEHRAFSVGRQTAGNAQDRRFSQRRIENLFWKIGRQFLS